MRILVLLGQMRREFLGRFSKQTNLLLNELCLIILVVNNPYAILERHTAQPTGHTSWERTNLKIYVYADDLCTKLYLVDICIVYRIMHSESFSVG